MKIINDLGEKFEINISQYHSENHYNKLYDSDWLDAELNMPNGQETVKIKLEFLIVEELEKMEYWLLKVLQEQPENKSLHLIDPNLQFRVMTRNKIKVLKVLYELAFDGLEIAAWELIITKQNLLYFIDQIREDLKKFPCRCNQQHDIANCYV